MKDHSWAFAAWEVERIKGTINSDSILLHVDDHLDDVPDGLYVEGILSAKNKDELFQLIRTREELSNGKVSKAKIYIDNFIWPSFSRGTLGTMFVVSPQEMPDFASVALKNYSVTERMDGYLSWDEIFEYIPKEKFDNVVRTHTYDEFKNNAIESFRKQAAHKSRILDLDLDFFVPGSSEENILPDTEIQRILSELLELCKWDLITVALSPQYCGGERNTKHLLDLFCTASKIYK